LRVQDRIGQAQKPGTVGKKQPADDSPAGEHGLGRRAVQRPDLGLNAPIDGRLDRLAVSDTEVLILDFKTNRPPPAREADVPPAYLAQMALYRAAAEAVFPGRRIVCGLLFTDGPRLLRLSDAVLDAQLGDIAARLDPDGVRS
jgi:ATP-dependent exoDNAse (exonuclease V) beta subunit